MGGEFRAVRCRADVWCRVAATGSPWLCAAASRVGGSARRQRLEAMEAVLGFTLVETLVAGAVLAIIGVTVAIVGFGLGRGSRRSEREEILFQLRTRMMAALRVDVRSAAAVNVASAGLHLQVGAANARGDLVRFPVDWAFDRRGATRTTGSASQRFECDAVLAADESLAVSVEAASRAVRVRWAIIDGDGREIASMAEMVAVETAL